MYLIQDWFLERDWVGVWYFLGAAALAAVAVALLLLTAGGGSPERDGAAGVRVVAPPLPAPRVELRRAAVGETVTVAGAAFTVVDRSRTGWARRVLAARPAPGRQLVVAAVDVVGRGRRHFDPALLSYLVHGPGGSLYAPLQSGIVGPSSISETRGLQPGETAEERLLFALPKSLRRPVLAIQPAPTRALEIRVPLAQ